MTQDTLKAFVLLGMPGVGKGTQAQLLVSNFALYHIDTGQTLRTEISSGTELGHQAKAYMDQGQLVPFELVMQVIKAGVMRRPDTAPGLLFDGFPRNHAQAEGLSKVLDELGLKLDAVLYLETPYDILFDRLAYRVTCGKCDAKYNLKLNPPKVTELCDVCQGELVTRKDDHPDVIQKRLQAYEEETAPLIQYYTERGLLRRINADQPIEAVTRDVEAQLQPYLAQPAPAQ